MGGTEVAGGTVMVGGIVIVVLGAGVGAGAAVVLTGDSAVGVGVDGVIVTLHPLSTSSPASPIIRNDHFLRSPKIDSIAIFPLIPG